MRTALEKLLTFSLKVISNLKTLSVWVFQYVFDNNSNIPLSTTNIYIEALRVVYIYITSSLCFKNANVRLVFVIQCWLAFYLVVATF